MGWKEDLARQEAEEDAAGAKGAAQTREAQTSAQTGVAKLPYVAPTAAAGVVSAQQGNQIDPAKWSREEMDAFKRRKGVAIYEISAPNFASALQTRPTPGDDKELVMLAAKIQDAEGSVREGDEKRFDNIDYALDHIQQQFKKDYLSNGGQFTDKGRREIREFLARRMNNYRRVYTAEWNAQLGRVKHFNEAGPTHVIPDDAIGPDYRLIDGPVLDDYTKKMKATDEIEAKRKKAAGAHVGLNEAPPPGAHIGGTPVTGWRLSPENEAEATLVFQQTRDPAAYANAVADRAVEEGKIDPEERDGLVAATLPGAQAWKDKYGKTDADWAKMPKTIDYSQVDQKARDDLTLPGAALHAIPNLPASAVQGLKSTLDIGLDAANSIDQGKPVGTTKALYDVGKGIMQGGDANTDAALAGLKERYGSWVGLKNTLATDPFGLGLDVTGVGGAALKLPGLVNAGARGIGKVASMIPANLQGYIANAGIRAAELGGKGLELPGKLTRGLVSIPSRTMPGEGLERAMNAGFRSGAGTSRPAERFWEHMTGKGEPEEIVKSAEKALKAWQKEASTAYERGMRATGQDQTILSFNDVDNALDTLKARAYYEGEIVDVSAAKVYDEAKAIVDNWKSLDPTKFHTPLGFDKLKQRLYGVGDTARTAGDFNAAAIADGVTGEVRTAIANQVPSYKATMLPYEEAASAMKEARDALSIKHSASTDTTSRKMLSIARKDVNTNFGQRRSIGEQLERHVPDEILDPVFAQDLKAWVPRGVTNPLMQSLAGGGVGLMGSLAAGGSGILPGLAMGVGTGLASSPRLMGMGAYGLGYGAGFGTRAGKALLNSKLGRGVTYLPRNYPVGTALGVQGASAIEGLGPEPDTSDPSLPPILSPDDEEIHVNRRSVPPPGMAYGGAVRALSQRYNCGGPVMVRR